MGECTRRIIHSVFINSYKLQYVMNKKDKKCYICGNSAVSEEHCPAKCFFPKQHRKNMITVPSCSQHNEATSLDDEYARLFIIMNNRNNKLSFEHFKDKVLKSLDRSPALKALVSPISSGGIIKIPLNRERLDKEMRKNAYALYFHKYNKPWNRELIVAIRDLVQENNQQDDYGKLIEIAEYECKTMGCSFEYLGENPEVFQYVFLETEEEEVLLKMVFYEGFDVWIIPKIDSIGPIY